MILVLGINLVRVQGYYLVDSIISQTVSVVAVLLMFACHAHRERRTSIYREKLACSFEHVCTLLERNSASFNYFELL